MKKIVSTILCIAILVMPVSFTGCSQKEPLKLGLGVHAYIDKVSNADGDTDGKANAVATFAAVLVDKDGKIVKCKLDTTDNAMSFTSAGQCVKAGEFATKYEQGDSYGMEAYAGSAKEWYEQADTLATMAVGKTLEEVKSLAASNGKGNEEVINAGCTIAISDFIFAIEKAVNNVAESDATRDETLQLGVVSTQTTAKAATADAEGENGVDITVTAAVFNQDGKVVAIITDALQAKTTFTAAGTATVEEGTALSTKTELGTAYGIAQYGADLNGDGIVKEWFEQAAAFDNICKGKTASEISALAADTGYGVNLVQTAGCTILVNDMVKAAAKAATQRETK